jgi:hypothetical protein
MREAAVCACAGATSAGGRGRVIARANFSIDVSQQLDRCEPTTFWSPAMQYIRCATSPLGTLSCVAVVALAGLVGNARAATVYYLDLVNNAASDVVAFDVARAGSETFHPLLRAGATLRGHGAASTVAIRLGDDGCRRDLRVRFADGATRSFRDFDLCDRDHGAVGDDGRRTVRLTDAAIEPAS